MNSTYSKEKLSSKALEKADVTAEISKIGVYAIAVSAGFIGVWAIICLVAGTVTSGGPMELLSNLFRAITG